MSPASKLLLGSFALSLTVFYEDGIGQSPFLGEFEELVAATAAEARQLIQTLEDSTTAASFNVRSDLIIVLQNLERISTEITDGTLDRVDSSVQTAVQDVQSLIEEFNSGNQESLSRLHDVSMNFGEAISRIPGVDDRPFVISYSPSLALEASQGQSSTFTINGTLLGDVEAELRFPTSGCELVTQTERMLQFNCNRIRQEEWTSAGLTLSHGGFWGFFQKETKYKISIRTIRDKIGPYEFVPIKQVTQEQKVSRSQVNSHRNDHCSGNRPLTWTYNPSKDCVIDITSVTARATVKSSKSSYGGVHNLSESGFQVRGSANNSGDCVKVFGETVSRDGRGALHVEVTWEDICKRNTLVDGEPVTGNLFWGNDVAISIDSSVVGFRLIVDQEESRASTKKKVVTAESIGDIAQGTDLWFNVEWQQDAKTVLIRPKPLLEAFD